MPVSQEFFASPAVAASGPGDHLRVDVRLVAVDVDLVLLGRGADGKVIRRAPGRPSPSRHQASVDPRVVVAEDAGVLLVARRVARDFAELELVGRDTAAGGARCRWRVASCSCTLSSASPGARPSSGSGAAQDAPALALDEDLALLGQIACRSACPRRRKRPQIPLAVPRLRPRRPRASRRSAASIRSASAGLPMMRVERRPSRGPRTGTAPRSSPTRPCEPSDVARASGTTRWVRSRSS